MRQEWLVSVHHLNRCCSLRGVFLTLGIWERLYLTVWDGESSCGLYIFIEYSVCNIIVILIWIGGVSSCISRRNLWDSKCNVSFALKIFKMYIYFNNDWLDILFLSGRWGKERPALFLLARTNCPSTSCRHDDSTHIRLLWNRIILNIDTQIYILYILYYMYLYS